MGKRSPRLQFTDEERTAPELKKAVRKADKKADRLEKADTKFPKKTVKRKQHIVDAEGNSYTVEVPYTYYICTVTLENFNLSHVPVYIMSEEQLSMYATYMRIMKSLPKPFQTHSLPL